MAYISAETAGAGQSAQSAATGFFNRIRVALIHGSVYRKSMNELNQLDNRALGDIAVSRGDFHQIAQANADRAVARFLASRA